MTPTDREQPSSKESYLAEPTNGDEYYQRGWSYYAKKEHERADVDFRRALELSPDHPDIIYAMGLNLQASGRDPEAVSAFERVVELLKDVTDSELYVRALMLTRLANGHINRIKTGDWNLSK